MKNKYLIIRTLEKSGSIIRLLGMVGIGAWFCTDIMSLYSTNSTIINSGHWEMIQIGTWTRIRLVLAVILFIALFFLGKFLDKIKEKNDYAIDNFEDTAKYSKKRKLPVGQLDDNGNMSIGLYLKRGIENPMQALDALIGLDAVKTEVKKIQALFEYEKKNKIGNDTCRHYVFLGNPGTGKTTIARIFAGLLYQNGRIKENKYLECTGNDLVGEYEGVTKNKVDAVYRRAKGGVLFIDEAYVLGEGEGPRANEAIVQLLVHMESDPYTVVIFAGYTENMQRFININPGLASRINKTLFFPDYTSDELLQICALFCDKQGLEFHPDAAIMLKYLFDCKTELNEKYNLASSNGRYARNCFNYIYEQHAYNCVANAELETSQHKYITQKDILDVKDKILQAN